jgi:hypothetical protein
LSIAVIDNDVLGLLFVVSFNFSIRDFSFCNIGFRGLRGQRVNHFLRFARVNVCDLELQTALLGHHRDRLVIHPSHKIARLAGNTHKRHLKHVGRYPLFHHLAHLMRHLVETIGRAKPANALMRSLEVIILDPQPRPVLHVLEPVKQRPCKKLLLDRFPEPLDFPLCLGMVRLRTDMPDLHPIHLLFKLRLAAPARVLPAIVRQHFRRGFVLRCRPA